MVDSSGATVIIKNNNILLNDIGIWDGFSTSGSTAPAFIVTGNRVTGSYNYGIVFDSVVGNATNNQVTNSPVGVLTTSSYANTALSARTSPLQT